MKFQLSLNILIYFFFLSFFISCSKYDTSTNYSMPNSEIIYRNGWGNSLPVSINISQNFVDATPYPDGTTKDLPTYIQNAVDIWNAAAGLTLLQIAASHDPQNGNSFTVPCSGITDRLYFPLCDNTNGIYMDLIAGPNTGWSFNTGKSSGVLATTLWLSNASNTIILKADIRFNRDNYIFLNAKNNQLTGDTTSENSTIKTYVDLQSVVTHEIGHLLGLSHIQTSSSIMFPSMTIGLNQTHRCLNNGDIDSIRTIYKGGVAADITTIQNKCGGTVTSLKNASDENEFSTLKNNPWKTRNLYYGQM